MSSRGWTLVTDYTEKTPWFQCTTPTPLRAVVLFLKYRTQPALLKALLTLKHNTHVVLVLHKDTRKLSMRTLGICMEYFSRFEVFNDTDFVINILRWHGQPKFRTVTNVPEVLNNYHLGSQSQLPELKVRTDPVARLLGLHVEDVVQIFRCSHTAAVSVYYRTVTEG